MASDEPNAITTTASLLEGPVGVQLPMSLINTAA